MDLTPGRSQQRFPQHLSHHDTGKGLKQGVFLKAVIRFNAQDRNQAFATIEGLPSDLMIRVRSLYAGVNPCDDSMEYSACSVRVTESVRYAKHSAF